MTKMSSLIPRLPASKFCTGYDAVAGCVVMQTSYLSATWWR